MSRRSVADTVIDCWPGPTHWMPCGSTVNVVSGVYDVGGSGPTAIRSSPGARTALLNTVTVLAPALSATGIAAVSTLGYGAQLVGPPLIGFLANRVGLGHALLVLVVLGGAITALAPAVRRA